VSEDFRDENSVSECRTVGCNSASVVMVVLGTRIAKYVVNTLRKITCNSDNTCLYTLFTK